MLNNIACNNYPKKWEIQKIQVQKKIVKIISNLFLYYTKLLSWKACSACIAYKDSSPLLSCSTPTLVEQWIQYTLEILTSQQSISTAVGIRITLGDLLNLRPWASPWLLKTWFTIWPFTIVADFRFSQAVNLKSQITTFVWIHVALQTSWTCDLVHSPPPVPNTKDLTYYLTVYNCVVDFSVTLED